MSEQTKLGLKILGAAALLGALGDGLLRAWPWGANLSVWVAALVAALLLASPLRPAAFGGGGWWLLAPIVVFSVTFAWRDSPALKLLSLAAVLLSLSLLVLRAQGGRLTTAGLAEYALGAAVAGVNTALGPLPVIFGCVRWNELGAKQHARRPLALLRGTLLALPVLALFAALLMTGDAVFAALVGRAFHLSFLTLFTHCALFAFFGWLVAGYLRGALLGGERGWVVGKRLPAPKLGITEVGVVLGLLDTLFLAFVLVQLRYLFGGAPLVGIQPGLTYAEYARSGFFQLVAVAALALPLLLGADWLLRREKPRDEPLFRLLTLAQVALLFVIMASALERMVLYQAAFGQTELRLYTTAFMIWLAVVFVWFVLTVLTGRRRRFAFGALLSGFLAIGTLLAINPDALIARINLARAAGGRDFDAAYAASLSDDAVPALVAGLPSLAPSDRQKLATRLLHRPESRADPGWRTATFARREAQRWLNKYRPLLEDLARTGEPGPGRQ